jgi:hypothetical protein
MDNHAAWNRVAFAWGPMLVLISMWLLPVQFEENDDVVMLLIASGAYSGVPDAHLVFMNSIIGHALGFLYSKFREVEWYTLFLVLVHACSVGTLFAAVAVKSLPNHIKLLFIALLSLLEILMLLQLQFTTTAAMATLAGLVVLLEIGSRYSAIGGLLVILGALIRLDAFILVLLISIPWIFSELMEVCSRNKSLTSAIVLALTLCGALLLHQVGEAQFSNSPEWKQYKEYNSIRGGINDNRNATGITEKLTLAAEKNDLQLLLEFMPNTKTVNSERLKEYRSLIRNVALTEKASNVRPEMSRHKRLLLPLALLVACGIACARISRESAVLGLTLMASLVLASLVSLDASLKTRVMLSAVIPVVYQCVRASANARAVGVCGAALAAVLASWCLGLTWQAWKTTERNRVEAREYEEQHQLIARYLSVPTKSVMAYGNHLRMEKQNPFHISSNSIDGKIAWGGWLSLFPLNDHPKESFKRFVDGKGLFVRRGSDALLSRIVESTRDSYGVQLTPRVVDASGCCLIVEFERSHLTDQEG